MQGRGKSRKTRWRRSISKERHVEALLVADTSMMTFHEDGDVETYILTIMNMVSALYRDASIGNTINVVVVRIILLEDEIAQVKSELSLITLICRKSNNCRSVRSLFFSYVAFVTLPRAITHTVLHSSNIFPHTSYAITTFPLSHIAITHVMCHCIVL